MQQSVEANERAVAVADERYTKGLAGFLDVLVSQRSLYLAQSDLTESQAQISENLVALYKALGGGWRPPCCSEQPMAKFTLPVANHLAVKGSQRCLTVPATLPRAAARRSRPKCTHFAAETDEFPTGRRLSEARAWSE